MFCGTFISSIDRFHPDRVTTMSLNYVSQTETHPNFQHLKWLDLSCCICPSNREGAIWNRE